MNHREHRGSLGNLSMRKAFTGETFHEENLSLGKAQGVLI
jgi:hypothetical protein